jgi:hypothetical protein
MMPKSSKCLEKVVPKSDHRRIWKSHRKSVILGAPGTFKMMLPLKRRHHFHLFSVFRNRYKKATKKLSNRSQNGSRIDEMAVRRPRRKHVKNDAKKIPKTTARGAQKPPKIMKIVIFEVPQGGPGGGDPGDKRVH